MVDADKLVLMYDVYYKNLNSAVYSFLENDVKSNINYYKMLGKFLSIPPNKRNFFDIRKQVSSMYKELYPYAFKESETFLISYTKNDWVKAKIYDGGLSNVLEISGPVPIYNLESIVHIHPSSLIAVPSSGDIDGLKSVVEAMVKTYLSDNNKEDYNKLHSLRYAVVSPYYMSVIEDKKFYDRVGLSYGKDNLITFIDYYGLSISIKWISKEEIDNYKSEKDLKNIVNKRKHIVDTIYSSIKEATKFIDNKDYTSSLSVALFYNVNIANDVAKRINKNCFYNTVILEQNNCTEKYFNIKNPKEFYNYVYPSEISKYLFSSYFVPSIQDQLTDTFAWSIFHIPFFFYQ